MKLRKWYVISKDECYDPSIQEFGVLSKLGIPNPFEGAFLCSQLVLAVVELLTILCHLKSLGA
jgi:hypothetical protein